MRRQDTPVIREATLAMDPVAHILGRPHPGSPASWAARIPMEPLTRLARVAGVRGAVHRLAMSEHDTRRMAGCQTISVSTMEFSPEWFHSQRTLNSNGHCLVEAISGCKPVAFRRRPCSGAKRPAAIRHPGGPPGRGARPAGLECHHSPSDTALPDQPEEETDHDRAIRHGQPQRGEDLHRAGGARPAPTTSIRSTCSPASSSTRTS